MGIEQSRAIEYVFPGELAAINIGSTAVVRDILIIVCNGDDLRVDIFEATMPEGADERDTKIISSLCIPTNRISILEGECMGLSYEGVDFNYLQLDIEHFYSMTSS